MPAAADTEPQPDTTPPSPAAASKAGGKKGAAAEKQALADAVETAAEQAPVEADQDAAPGPPAPEPGWFRNTAATELTVIPHMYPSKTLAPGEATWLPDDPRNPNLERCDAPAPDATAADTQGSEQ